MNRQICRNLRLGLALGLSGCALGIGDAEPPETQRWAVTITGTVMMADAPFAPLLGATVSLFTCDYTDVSSCTPNVTSDSLGHYSVAHTYVVPVCKQGSSKAFFLGTLSVDSQGYGTAWVMSGITTDFCGAGQLVRDFAMRRSP